MLVRVAVLLLLLLATVAPASAEGLDEAAKEAEHMVEDVARAKSASPAEARALAREIADHGAETEEALERAAGAGGASKSTIDIAIAGAKRVVAAAQATQRASDGDVPARVRDLEVAVGAFVPQLRTAAAAAPAAGLPRTGGLPAAALAGVGAAGLLLVLAGRRLGS